MRVGWMAIALLTAQPADAREPFAVRVVDADTGRGVPLVELRTVNNIRLWTDSNGVAAFDEPGLMDKDVFFAIKSHGYEFAADGFGFRGKALTVTPGGSAKLTIKRLNIAERLYRVTGGGIYRDSLLVGEKAPLKEPLLNGLVFGSDSVVNVRYRDKIYWFWGDTNKPSYPLGNFQVPGATSELPGKGGLDPEVGVDLRYFVDAKGFAKETMRMPGKGPTWLTTAVMLPDDKGRERLYGSYIKIEPPLKIYARGLAVFDDAKEQFEHVAEVDMKGPVFPSGHAFCHGEHIYFAHPFPATRVKADGKHFLNVDEYETFTCLKDGSRLADGQFDRDAKGGLRYAWRKNTPAIGPGEEAKLIAAGKITREEARWQLRDIATGKTVLAHSGSVYWNAHRRRWVMIAVQSGGTSFLGEVWYAEADTPTGPWNYAVKIVTHDRCSFYNPKQHPMFDKVGGRVIFFEGTYTHTFSGNDDATPRYDYNQVLYKLDLGDPRLALPVAIYRLADDSYGTIAAVKGEPGVPAFFAVDRPIKGSVPIRVAKDRLKVGDADDIPLAFHAIPADIKDPPPGTTPLFEHRGPDGEWPVYSTEPDLKMAGYKRAEKPLCRVWR